MYYKRFDHGTDGFSVSSDGVRTMVADPRFSGPSQDATSYLQDLFDEASSLNNAEFGRIKLIVPAGIWMVDALQPKPNVIYSGYGAQIRKRSAPTSILTNSLIRGNRSLVGGTTYYGNYDNMEWHGFTFSANGFQCPANIVRFDEARDLLLKDITVIHTTGVNSWATQISGQRVRVENIRVLNGAAVFQDGLHLTYGRDFEVVGGYIQSGDDAIALGYDIVAAGQEYDDEALECVTVSNVTVNSIKGYAVKPYYGRDTQGLGGTNRRRVRNINVIGITGRAGQLSNCGLGLLLDTNENGADPSVMQNINIEANLQVGSTTHDGANPFGVHVTSGENVTIKAKMRFTDKSSGDKFRPIMIEGGRNISISLQQAGSVGRACSFAPRASTTVCDNIRIENSDIIAGNVDGISGFDINNAANATVGPIKIKDTTIRGIRNGSYGVLRQASNVVSKIEIDNVTFKKNTGATTSYGYATSSATAVTTVKIVNSDFSDVNNASLGSFNTNHANYYVNGNANFSDRTGGTY